MELEVRQVEAQALIFELPEYEARALLLNLDPSDTELSHPTECAGMLLNEVERMSPEELRNGRRSGRTARRTERSPGLCSKTRPLFLVGVT
ncbi:hypothetical protein [Deinococcus sp. Leaf326]|uniref:hypothetical protein n=1 Tax=Deinococcus sp. Leaf326 TaxID=1736338 RepID=UPI0012E14D4A|nr:hypothetical protein [Deinococcus sp. Leaf326]